MHRNPPQLRLSLSGHLVVRRIVGLGTNSVGGVLAQVFGLLERVEMILTLIVVVEAEPERDTADKGNDGNDTVVPYEKGIIGKGSEGLTDGGGEGAGEEVDGHDEGLHVLGGLGEGVLVAGDVGEELGDTDEDVRETLGPHIDGRGVASLTVGVIAAGRLLVNVVLHDAGSNHREGSEEETDGHALDGGKVDANLAETGVDQAIENGDHDDNGDGVKVLDNIVGHTVELHGSGLRGEVTGHLVVGKMENGEEDEDLAGKEATSDFVDPSVIVSHPRRAFRRRDLGGASSVPVQLLEPTRLPDDVDEHAQELGQDGSGGGSEPVLLLLRPKHKGGGEEEDCGEQESQPEADVLFNPHHGNLADGRTDIDGEVEVEEDTGVGNGRINNDTLSLADLDAKPGIGVLLSKHGRDVGLEEASTNAKGKKTDDEGAESRMRLRDNTGSGRRSQDDVGNRGNGNGDVDSDVSTKFGIGDPGTVFGVRVSLGLYYTEGLSFDTYPTRGMR